MALTAKAPRGGLAETVGGKSRVLILRNGEVERFEDAHRGIFEVWDGFMGRAKKPGLAEVRDLVALGLVGGGMTDKAADKALEEIGLEGARDLYAIAHALVGVAFTPDLALPDEDAPEDEGDEKKKVSAPGSGTSAD
ncbi:GTA-gp10 family protein [Sulfitobacter sp. 1A16787]|uniref:GTA-gp10 family protein n=1 Tax=Sulfitobacter sp. 1A16787 TaxID=3368571 RepID=UPI0037458DEB